MPSSNKRVLGYGFIALMLVILTVLGAMFFLPDATKDSLLVIGEPVVALSQDEKNFDPIKEQEHVEFLAGTHTGFVSMLATHVRRDGTIDLTESPITARVSYAFSSQELHQDTSITTSKRVRNISINAYPPGKRVVNIDGQKDTEQYEIGLRKEDLGLSAGRYRPWPFPTCNLRGLWDYAAQKGAPETALAVVEFKDGKYTFSIPDTTFRFHFDQSCRPIS